MNHAKKMILVDPNMIEQLHQVEDTKPKTLNLLDGEMQSVLENKNLPDHEKWTLYEQVLQKYLNIINYNRQPIEIPLTVTQQQPPTQQQQTTPISQTSLTTGHTANFNNILLTLPKSFRNKGNLFLQKLRSDKNISWDSNGTVYAYGNIIQDSNITDLVNDFVRSRKTAYNPKGWNYFADVLRHINMPMELIGNKQHREHIISSYGMNQSVLEEAAATPLPNLSTESESDYKEKSLFGKKGIKESKKEEDNQSTKRRSFWEKFNL